MMNDVVTGLIMTRRRGLKFDATFRTQYLLTRNGIDLPGWNSVKLKRWHFDHCPALPVSPIKDGAGRSIGIFVGWGIDASGSTVTEPTVKSSGEASALLAEVERFIEGCAGRYLVILDFDEVQRVYADPIVNLAVTYNPSLERVAGSTFLALRRRAVPAPPFVPENLEAGLHYAMGATADRNVSRLLGDHYLDLQDFSTHRHWPRAETDIATEEGNEPAIMDALIERLSAICHGVLDGWPTVFPLSGGRDSRVLLGCSRQDWTKPTEYLSWMFHRMSKYDAFTAAYIAERLGLDHRVLPYEKMVLASARRIRLRTGGEISYEGPQAHSTIERNIKPGPLMIRGNVMEMLRGTCWNGQSEGDPDFSHLLKRTRWRPERWKKKSGISDEARATSMLTQKVESWWAGLPDNAKSKPYDLGFSELLLPHTMGVWSYSAPENPVFNPYNDREIIRLTMKLPAEYRMADHGYDYILAKMLPELDQVPFVTPGELDKLHFVEEMQNKWRARQ